MDSEAAGRWVRPGSRPEWGHRDGLRIGLAPLPGPRGLIRVYAPHLDLPEHVVVNFVAVEPIVAGGRGLSELERSGLDGVPGKRFWTGDFPTDVDREPGSAVRGTVDAPDGVERLTVIVHVEPFENGAAVSMRVRFRADRPHEVALAAFRRPGSAELEACVLTATMGNYGRLRRLALADGEVTVAGLWPGLTGGGFAPHRSFPLERLVREDGAAVVRATSDESDPAAVPLAPGTPEHWRYAGRPAAQSWRSHDPVPGLVAQVNARAMYWAGTASAGDAPIPGGPAFENVELVEPFAPGREVVFGVEPVSPG